MTRDPQGVDELIERSRPRTIVVVAAAALAVQSLLVALVGLQVAVFLGAEGPYRLIPFGLIGLGAFGIAVGFGLGRAFGPATWGSIVTSALLLLLSSVWAFLATFGGVFSLLGLVAPPAGLIGLALAAIAYGPAAEAARAARALAATDIGGGGAVEAVQAEIRASRRSWSVVLVIVLVLGAAVFVGVGLAMRAMPGRPTRVAVVRAGGIDPAFDAIFAGNVDRWLSDEGFDVVVAEEAIEGDDLAAGARRIASEAEAGHALVLELESGRERDGAVPGSALWAVTLTVHLVPGAEEAAPQSRSLAFAFEGASAAEVADRVQITWMDALLPWAMTAIFASPSFSPALAGEVSLDDMPFSTALREKRAGVDERRRLVEGFEAYCGREAESLRALSAAETRGVRCLGDPCGQYTLIGVDQADRAVVQDVSREPIYGVPPSARMEWSESPERIVALPLDGESPELPLLRAGHFYSFGRLSPDGRFGTVLPFGMGGVLAVHTLDLSSGARRAVTLLGPRERVVGVQPAPDGEGALALVRRGPWVVLRGGQRVELFGFSRAVWIETASGLRVAGQLETGELATAGLDGLVSEGRLALSGAVRDLVPRADGKLAVFMEGEAGCSLLTVDPAGPTLEAERALPHCLDAPRLLPDGRVVGTAETSAEGDVPGDPEVVVVDPEAGAAEPLTSGPYVEELVYPTRDGRRLVFNRRLADWPREHDVGLYRRVVCTVEVPPRAAPASASP